MRRAARAEQQSWRERESACRVGNPAARLCQCCLPPRLGGEWVGIWHPLGAAAACSIGGPLTTAQAELASIRALCSAPPPPPPSSATARLPHAASGYPSRPSTTVYNHVKTTLENKNKRRVTTQPLKMDRTQLKTRERRSFSNYWKLIRDGRRT